MTDTPGTLRLGGDPVPELRSAEFGITATVPNERWSAGGLDAAAVEFWITLVVDERSGEDGEPIPEVQTLPVARAAGRIPRLAELPGLAIDDQDDWDAWIGNDAPPLVENRLTFGPWDGDRIAAQWEAKVDESWRENWPEGPEPGRLRYEGALRLAKLTAHTADPENADVWMRATWGTAAIDACERSEGPWCAPVPVFGGRWKAVWYAPKAGFTAT